MYPFFCLILADTAGRQWLGAQSLSVSYRVGYAPYSGQRVGQLGGRLRRREALRGGVTEGVTT